MTAGAEWEARMFCLARDTAQVRCGGAVFVANAAYLETQQSPYVFEGPSFEIWTRIDGERSEEQIVDELTELYGAPREQIAADVRTFLTQLLELHLIEETPQDSV